MWRPRTTAIVATLLLLTSVLAPAAIAETPLSIDVSQDAGGATTVTVTHDGTAVENATLTVDAPNATYPGEGEHETDANGTVELPAPAEDVTVDVTAADGNSTGSTTVDLQAPTLDVDVQQARRGHAGATVTYAITGEPVENATVNVTTVDENATYAGEGDYTADANGTVGLPAPEDDVTVEAAAEHENLTGSATADLAAPSLDVAVEQSDGGNATATVTYAITGDSVNGGAGVTVSTVDENATYAGEGDYTADANGTVELPAPDEDIEVEVVASHANLTGSTTVELQEVEEEPDDGSDTFGARVSAVVHSLLGDRGDGHPGIGRSVAAWVLGHNPGNAPDHAGPPDGERGPPAPAGDDPASNGNASASVDVEPDDGSEDGDDDEDGGPPSHAGPPDGDRGNGKAKGR